MGSGLLNLGCVAMVVASTAKDVRHCVAAWDEWQYLVPSSAQDQWQRRLLVVPTASTCSFRTSARPACCIRVRSWRPQPSSHP